MCSSRRPLPHRYDLSRISQPYLRELANLRDGSTATTAVKEVGRRLGLRPVDIQQAVSQPRTVAALAGEPMATEGATLAATVTVTALLVAWLPAVSMASAVSE